MADDSTSESTDAVDANRLWWQAFGRALLHDDLQSGGSTDETRNESRHETRDGIGDELRSLRNTIERITSEWFLAGPGREIDRRLARIERRIDELAESRDRASR
ncbi:MAG: hypothetical protein VX672_02560 [Planctomycetota bacterium]|nr:hypothetical protein [Planctomycetota bacterium]